MASVVAAERTAECGEVVVKRERLPSPEAMDTNNNNNLEGEDTSAAGTRRSFLGSEGSQSRAANMRSARHLAAGSGGKQGQAQPGLVNNSSSRQTSADYPGRRTSTEILRSLISPEFPSHTGTPTSISQLIPSAFSLEGIEFATPMGSGRLSPQTTDRLNRKRALSNSPQSSSSLDLNSLIRTSPTSLVNYITTSRGSSAGSFGHLSPSLFSNIHQQQPHSRQMPISLRNLPVHHSFNSQQNGFAEGENPMQVKKEFEGVVSPPSQHCSTLSASRARMTDKDIMKMEDMRESMFDGCNINNIKMEPGLSDSSFMPPPLISLGLETVMEEPGGVMPSEEDDLMQSDPMDYSDMLDGNDCEVYETKLGIIDGVGDSDKQKRVYYSYPSVEEPHNNQCKWAECSTQCEDLDRLVQHVNNDHIYRDSKKDFVCHWTGCVREKKPFKAQYMLLVHMRRHTGEKPHKCTYEGCYKAYSRLENLKTHLRSHTGERPYVCKYEGCGKAFSNASDCAKHMNRTHSDEKPYACPNPGCTKRYTDPSSRRKHLKNCQMNKKARKDNPDADGDNSAETAANVKSSTASKKPPRKKSTPSVSSVSARVGLSGDYGYGSGSLSGNSQTGYVSGGSQGYPSSQMGYSSGYDDADYSGLQEDEISRILQEQRLSDPIDVGGQRGTGHVTNHAHMLSQQYHFQSPPFQPSPLSPSQQFIGPPPPLVSSSSVPVSSRQMLPDNAHHRSRQQNHTPSSGYSSFRSSDKSPNNMTNSYSTFSSTSSRVSSPCSSSDQGVSLLPQNHIPGGQRGDIEGAVFPQKHSLRVSNSYPRHYQEQQQQHSTHHVRRHSDDMSNSSRGCTHSSQSSCYSGSYGSELSDDPLENLPSDDKRRNSFSKRMPLPLPESMQHNFSTSFGGIEYRTGEQQNVVFSQHQNGFADSIPTMPLRHFDHSFSSQPPQDGLFSQESAHLSGDRYEAYVSMMQHMSSSGNSMVSPGSNMAIGSMETFAHTLPEENQFFESIYHQSRVNAQVK